MQPKLGLKIEVDTSLLMPINSSKIDTKSGSPCLHPVSCMINLRPLSTHEAKLTGTQGKEMDGSATLCFLAVLALLGSCTHAGTFSLSLSSF